VAFVQRLGERLNCLICQRLPTQHPHKDRSDVSSEYPDERSESRDPTPGLA